MYLNLSVIVEGIERRKSGAIVAENIFRREAGFPLRYHYFDFDTRNARVVIRSK